MSPLFGRPASDATAPSLAPRSKPLIVAFAIVTGPEITRRSSGPLIPRSTSSVPCRSDAPEGSVMPSAGSAASSSVTRHLLPVSFRRSAIASPAVPNSPVSRDTALPTWTSPCFSTPVLRDGL